MDASFLEFKKNTSGNRVASSMMVKKYRYPLGDFGLILPTASAWICPGTSAAERVPRKKRLNFCFFQGSQEGTVETRTEYAEDTTK